MKLAGLVLIFAGVLSLLKVAGVILSWSVIWPILLIFVGIAVKNMRCRRMCGLRMGMGNCKGGSCGSHEEMEDCEGGKCEGEECGECKK